MIFSIADIQNEQEPEFEEGEEGVEDGAEDAEASLPPYPLRCSFSFTKVCRVPRVPKFDCTERELMCFLPSRLPLAR